MNCPKCQQDNPDTKKFCRNCGAKLLPVCPKCGGEIVPEDRFCGECGHDLSGSAEPATINYAEPQSYTPKHLADKILATRSAMEGEQKIVTVMFADVSGFTSMSEKLEPEEVHQIMDGCFKILIDAIHGFDGTVTQFTGDGVMALFGAPVALEGHAIRACQAGLDIQNALGPYSDEVRRDFDLEFKMRIGLNSGPVIVSSIGDDLKMEYTALGDTVNLASRMETGAAPGSILVSQNTYRIAEPYFEFDNKGELDIKGKDLAQAAYELVQTGDIATQDEDGYLFIVDRKKDMVIAGGYNIYPRDIDEVLYQHPKILDAISVGIPHEYRGETIKAYVVLGDGETATEEEIVEFCKEKLAVYKVPKMVEFRDELPKSAVGKILRKVLREEEAAKLK